MCSSSPSGPTSAMKSEGKFPKTRASSSWSGSVRLKSSRVRRAVPSASGKPARRCSRPSAVSPVATPPGTAQAGWIRFPATVAMRSCPHLLSRIPSRASSGRAAAIPSRFRVAGSAS